MSAPARVEERYLLEPALTADPYPYLDQLRDQGPVHWSPLHQAWLVTGHEQVQRSLRHPQLSADRLGPMREAVPAGARDDAERAFAILARWMVFTDPPHHRRLRQVFSEQFSARAIGRYRRLVERMTRASLARRAVAGRTGDLVADLARPLPAQVFGRWLGVPAQDGPSFWFWNARIGDLVLGAAQDERAYRTSLQSLVALEDYLTELVARRRAEPADDLVSAVLAEGRVGSTVTGQEFVGLLTQMAFAGGETTSNLVANAVRALLQHPDELAAVRADPGLVPAAIEETLRFDGPSKMSVRSVVADLQLAGAHLRAGDKVFLVTAAANRDPARFADPHTFSVRRGDAGGHLGLGHGPHFCIGAALARLVTQVVLDVLVRERPGLALVDDRHAWQPSLLNRSLTALPVRY